MSLDKHIERLPMSSSKKLMLLGLVLYLWGVIGQRLQDEPEMEPANNIADGTHADQAGRDLNLTCWVSDRSSASTSYLPLVRARVETNRGDLMPSSELRCVVTETREGI